MECSATSKGVGFMKIGIFGGSFNPPHKMHEKIALYLKEHHYLDKIIFVPTGQKYSYKTNLANDEHRLNMLQLLTETYSFMEISDFELKNQMVYTYETLAHFKSIYPNDDIYFICGLDNLSYMESWKNGKEILTQYKILVINRDTHQQGNVLKKLASYQENIEIVHLKTSSISSTKIRNQLNEEKKDSSLHPKVLQYIKDHHLYEDKGGKNNG